MNLADWDLVIRSAGAVVATIVVPGGLWAYQLRTGVLVTDQQRAAVYNAVATLTGQLQTHVDVGAIRPGSLVADHPAVLEAAAQARMPVAAAADAQGVSVEDLARLAVARVDTAARTILAPLPQGPAIPRMG